MTQKKITIWIFNKAFESKEGCIFLSLFFRGGGYDCSAISNMQPVLISYANFNIVFLVNYPAKLTRVGDCSISLFAAKANTPAVVILPKPVHHRAVVFRTSRSY